VRQTSGRGLLSRSKRRSKHLRCLVALHRAAKSCVNCESEVWLRAYDTGLISQLTVAGEESHCLCKVRTWKYSSRFS
jgi:hypothetical protein